MTTAIGQIVRTMRTNENMTLKDLANESGLSVSYLSDIERGRTEPSIATLRSIARGLGTTVADIFQASSHDLTEDEWHLVYAWRANDWRAIALMLANLGDSK